MKNKSAIRCTTLATLLVFAIAATGLQPLFFSLASSCTCEAGIAAESSGAAAASSGAAAASSGAAAESSCCSGSKAVQEPDSCCAAKATIATTCCCNRQALACECGDCGCSNDNDSKLPVPAIPNNGPPEIVTPTLICSSPIWVSTRDSEVKRVDYLTSVAEFTALSSQQQCVLLSRFTC